MIVFLAKRARREARRIELWWREHREVSPDLFTEELANAVQRLEEHGTRIGQPYSERCGRQVYRLLLKKTEQHVYFRHDPPDTIMVLAVWGGRRKRGPKL